MNLFYPIYTYNFKLSTEKYAVLFIKYPPVRLSVTFKTTKLKGTYCRKNSSI